MKFCVLVKISKHKLTFWYQTGTSMFSSLIIKDSNEIPLYFYVDGNDFIFGDPIAQERFVSNDPRAFGNYFEIIKDPSNHFIIAGNKKPVKQLLYYGIEKYLNYFINTVLYKNDSLESYRQSFPLRFWFDSDIENKEKSLIGSLFSEAGYDNIEQVNYDACLFQALIASNVISSNASVVLLSGIDNTLHLKLFKNLNGSPNSLSKLDGYGTDPSVKLLAEMIFDDILAQESYLSLDKEKEVMALLAYSAERLVNITPIIKGEVLLTDGKKHYFEVKQIVLNERLLYYSNYGVIYSAINELLSSHNIRSEDITILLGSKEISTPYLVNKLSAKYPNVKGLTKVDFNDALALTFYKIAQSDYLSNKNLSGAEIHKENSVQMIKTSAVIKTTDTNNVAPSSNSNSSSNLPPRVNTAPKAVVPPKAAIPPIINSPPALNIPPAAMKSSPSPTTKKVDTKPPLPPPPPKNSAKTILPPPPPPPQKPSAKLPPPPPKKK